MRWISLPLIGACLVATTCDRSGDFITETDPFLSERIPTPQEDHAVLASRAKAFAELHRMRLHYVPGHFQESEFTISVTRQDLSIVSGNVARGNKTLVTAYSRRPSPQQRQEVRAFICEVMRYKCVAPN